jgi:hypothetical protein
LRPFAAVAIVANPYGGYYVDDLAEATAASVKVGEVLAQLAVEATGT